MLFISHCYSELGIQFAAKYYALAAAYVAMKSNDPNVLALSSAALASAAECEYYRVHGVGLRNWPISTFGHRSHS